MSAEASPLAVRNRLDEIVDPCSEARGTDISIVEMGLLKRIEIEDGTAHIELRITSPSCMMVGYFIEQANKRVGSLPGIEDVSLETDAGLSWREEMMSEDAKERRREHQQALADRYHDERNATTTAPVSED
ncbi:metal-sulfur cluster assembly factor [Natrinema salsiterrestre]|uniref:Iron-sulfur cluster assembly protein n=1 Tax=Natrinema salsiterrestre TaxID=2950540 RepID=A0A9Q4KZX8_9EURY|nr:iron-sulfur cluster assembly protein [Natrinema salsiterrestre]MDF9747355.1 iron-sulfur cluster assembly protein [Natrinema salsiterrestre]